MPSTASVSRASPIARVDLEPPGPDWEKLDRMLEDLPPGIPILPPEDAGDFSKYRNKPHTVYAKDEAWQNCVDAMSDHDTQLCKGYREEIDTLLVFAGLFSAVVTGFTVESYQWLQDDPNDLMIALLSQIALSVERNNTAPTVAQRAPNMSRSVTVRINAYWFLSLSLSLVTALVAILGKQWVREFERRAPLSPRMAVGVRQLKLEGLEFWKVGPIISALPLLLQLALALFALGVLELLWHLYIGVAIVVCVPASLAALFYVTTTALPVVQYGMQFRDGPGLPQCAYKSPEAFLVMQAYRLADRAWVQLLRTIRVQLSIKPAAASLFRISDHLLRRPIDDLILWGKTPSWGRCDEGFYLVDQYRAPLEVPLSSFRGIRWVMHHVHNGITWDSAWNCLWDETNALKPNPYDNRFLPDPATRRERSRRSVLHALDAWNITLPSDDSPRGWAILNLRRSTQSAVFIFECLAHNLLGMDIPTATQVFIHLRDVHLPDADTSIALARAVASYCRQPAREHIVLVVACASDIVTSCSDEECRSALQAAMVALTLNWLRAGQFQPGTNLAPVLAVLSNALDCVCRDLADFVRHPHRIREMPHVREVAALVRAVCEDSGHSVTWPLPDGDPALRECIRQCAMHRPYFDYSGTTLGSCVQCRVLNMG